MRHVLLLVKTLDGIGLHYILGVLLLPVMDL